MCTVDTISKLMAMLNRSFSLAGGLGRWWPLFWSQSPHTQLAKAVYSDRGSELALSGSCRPSHKELPIWGLPRGGETPPLMHAYRGLPQHRGGSSIFHLFTNGCLSLEYSVFQKQMLALSASAVSHWLYNGNMDSFLTNLSKESTCHISTKL